MRKPNPMHHQRHYRRLLKAVARGLLSLIIGACLALAMVALIIGASIQHADRSAALAVMEVSE